MAKTALIPLANIKVLDQVRKTFDPAAHMEMVDSVKTHGIVQPILVRPADDHAHPEDAETFILVAGERRLRAAKEAGLENIPALIAFALDTHDVLQLVENLHRSDLSLEETAAGVDRLYKRMGKMSDVCRTLGKSMPWVSKMVSVANKLGPYATELLAGGFSQDPDLLTTLTRAENLENAWPRIELLVEEIKAKRAGRAEVIALYDELKKELEDSTDDAGEEGQQQADDTPDEKDIFIAVDTLHAKLKEETARLIAGWPVVLQETKDAAALDAAANAALKLIGDGCKAYVAHVQAMLSAAGIKPTAPAPSPAPSSTKVVGIKQPKK